MSTAVVDALRGATVHFRAFGIPRTQGSLRAFLPKGHTRPIVTHDKRPDLLAWRGAISAAAREAWPYGPMTGPLHVRMTFFLPRPKTMPAELRTERQRAQWAHPWRRPDLDKLCRGILDSLKGVVLGDDGQIVSLKAEKVYGERPGVWVGIVRVNGQHEC